MKGVLLDTHYWYWLQTGNSKELRPPQVDQLTKLNERRELFVSDISILEIARLEAGGRIPMPVPTEIFVETARESELTFLPVSARVLIESTRLPGELHRDPCDRILIATAREHGLTLFTRDARILAYAKTGHLNARKL